MAHALVETSGETTAALRDLTVSFRGDGRPVAALRGVSFDIGSGEIVALVGESGAGKTVLGLTLLGLLPSDPPPRFGGRAEVCGIDMTTAAPELRRTVRRRYLGAVFQDPMSSLNPTMRIGRQVLEAAGSHHEALRLLQEAGLPRPQDRFDAYPHELSGGQRQRVMIAMAIAGSPALVVADEPTTALDVTVQAQILALFRRLRDEVGCSFLVITHDLSVAAQVADRVVVLYAGRVAEAGQIGRLLRRPDHPYTTGLLRTRLTLQTPRVGALPTLRGEPPDPRQPLPACAFAPRCELAVERCTSDVPALRPRADGAGAVACHRAGEATGSDERAPPAPLAPSRRQAEEGEPLIRLRGVTKTFAARVRGQRRRPLQALRGVDLDLRPGESLAIVGETGCGKSTLLRIVAGLERPDGGMLELRSERRPQMVFQDAGASLTPWLRVGELLREPLRYDGGTDAAALVAAALRAVGLPEAVMRLRPVELSGGQRQRVAIARAVVTVPPLLLCDEPTSALDVALASLVLNLLLGLREELGMGLIFVTHDLAVARVVGDRIAVMYLGRIVESGPAEEVVRRPRHPYTRALLASLPGPKRALAEPTGEPADPLDPPPGCPYHPRCPLAVDLCRREDPPFREDESGSWSACWRSGEAAALAEDRVGG